MSIASVLILTVALLWHGAWANVEKTIFVAPLRQPVPDASIDNLLLVPLNPQHATIRTWINATFPTETSSHGFDTWMLLEGLSPGQRYEVRVCWIATQPTAFNLHAYNLAQTFEDPALLSSLTDFSNAQRALLDLQQRKQLEIRKHKASLLAEIVHPSLLFLRISAAADYFSLNKTLMEHVQPVLVDIILDKYAFGIFPESLLPTAGYIIALAVGSWFLSAVLWRTLSEILRSSAMVVDESKKMR